MYQKVLDKMKTLGGRRVVTAVFIHSFYSFIISQGAKQSSYKTKQTLKMQTCSNDTMITQDTIVPPVGLPNVN